jgi:hypothetical protein
MKPSPTTQFCYTLSLLTLSLLTGCFSTTLPPIPAPAALPRLVSAADTRVPLYLSTPQDTDRLGFQYLLMALPVSRIYSAHLADLIRTSLTTQAGFGRVGLVAPSRLTPMPIPRLMVNVRSVSVNGWDLLIIRRPSASITLSAEYYTSTGRAQACEVTGSHSKLSPFAFERDLNEVLELASDDAARQLLACLRLGDTTTLHDSTGIQ